jgi:hypothetical protein
MSWFSFGNKPPGASPGGSAHPVPALVPLGAVVRCGQYEVLVASIDPYVYVGQSSLPEGVELWATLVELASVHHEPVHYAPHKWHLFDREHFEHETFGVPYARQPQLGNSYLAPGARVRGYVTFKVPTGTVPARLCFVADSRAVVEFDAVPVQ